jgi:hypothetical protein
MCNSGKILLPEVAVGERETDRPEGAERGQNAQKIPKNAAESASVG